MDGRRARRPRPPVRSRARRDAPRPAASSRASPVDLDRAIELKEELAAVGRAIELQRPNWKAATLADLCEIALDQDDLPAARRTPRRARRPAAARAPTCALPSSRSARRPRRRGVEAASPRSPASTRARSTTPAASSSSARRPAAQATTRVRGPLPRRAPLLRGARRRGGVADASTASPAWPPPPTPTGRGACTARRDRLRETRGRRPIRSRPAVAGRARRAGRPVPRRGRRVRPVCDG